MAGAQFVKKKPDVVSALRPAFFIQYLESCISRLNVIPCHDLTLSVGEPDNAAAKLRSEQTVTPLHEQSPATYFLRLNNLETFVELVGARPLHLLSQTVLPLKSPTGAFKRQNGLCVLSAAVEGGGQTSGQSSLCGCRILSYPAATAKSKPPCAVGMAPAALVEVLHLLLHSLFLLTFPLTVSRGMHRFCTHLSACVQ